MRTVRHFRTTAMAAAIAALGLGTALAQDSMGGMDRPFTNAGNIFGHGAWGNGRGTAIPLPDPRWQYGMYYDQAYDGGENLFGTGFWAAEYMARRGESSGRSHGDGGHDGYDGGVGHDGHGMNGDYGGGVGNGKDHTKLGDGYGKDGGYEDKGGYDKGGYDKGHKNGHMDKGGYDKGEYDKGGYDKGGYKKGGYDKHDKGGYDKHDKGGYEKHDKEMMHKEKVREVTRYIPYARREVFVGGRSYSDIVVVQREQQTLELGHVQVTEQRHVETFGAVCLTGKGDEVPAMLTTDRGDDDSYQGEIFRCPANATLRVSYSTGAARMAGEVDMEDGTSYADCDDGEALVRTGSGDLVCAPKRRMSREAEQALARSYGAETELASYDNGDSGDDRSYGGEEVDLSGLQLTGGVGNTGGY